MSDSIGKAHSLLKSKQVSEALVLLDSIRPPQADLSAYHAVYGAALEEAGSIKEAIEHYKIAYLFARSDDMREELLLKRCTAYNKMLYFSEAAVCLGAFLKKYPASLQREAVHFLLAQARMELGEYMEARRHFEQAGRSIEARYGKANALHAMGMYKDAHEMYLSLIPQDRGFLNSSEQTRLYVGENFRVMNRTADAKIYLNSVQSRALRPRAALGLGLIAEAEGRMDEAVRLFREASEGPDKFVRRRGLISYADALIRSGKASEAEAPLLEVRNYSPYGSDYDEAMLLLSQAYRKEQRFEEAISVLRGLLFRRSPDRDVLDELEALVTAVMAKKPEMLSQVWDSAGQWLLDASRADMLLRLARTLRCSGKPFLDICMWLNKYGPDQAKTAARLLLADFYARMGDYHLAQRYLDAARSVQKEDEFIRVSARINFWTGAKARAAQELMSLKRPAEEDILLLLDSKEFLRAPGSMIEFVEKALKKLPGTVRVYTRFADLLYETGQVEDARRYYEAAANAVAPLREQDRKDAEWARYRLASMRASTGKAAKAPKVKSPEDRFADADTKAREIELKARKVL